MTYRLLEQKNRELGVIMCVATINFAKEFDTIRHEAIWSSLQRFKISNAYIYLLKKLYSDQRATVWTETDTESEEFKTERGCENRETP